MSPSSSPTVQAAEAANQQRSENAEQALVMLTSGALQTQGMAMVLARAMQEQGVQLSILLCDTAGDLAIEGYQSPQALAPHDMRPEGLLQKIIEAGASVTVCALYLPNSAYQKQDLRAGISVAQPAQVAIMMRDKNSRVFTF